MWGPSNNGKFSVKSAYYLEHKRMKSVKGESLAMDNLETEWNLIWGLNVSGAVKHFMWKAGQDYSQLS